MVGTNYVMINWRPQQFSLWAQHELVPGSISDRTNLGNEIFLIGTGLGALGTIPE